MLSLNAECIINVYKEGRKSDELGKYRMTKPDDKRYVPLLFKSFPHLLL